MKPGGVKKGDQVHIRGEYAGSVLGVVREVWTVDNLPKHPDVPRHMTAAVAEILREWDVPEVLWLTYEFRQHELMFVVLVRSDGETRDLQEQLLKIEPLTEQKKARLQ